MKKGEGKKQKREFRKTRELIENRIEKGNGDSGGSGVGKMRYR